MNNNVDKYLDEEIISHVIRDYAYKNGNSIYEFMKTYKIGESDYGRIMDAAAQGKGVIAHRLYGHNLIYDFPIKDLQNSGKFLEHIFSDLFTKQGITILPGEILDDVGLLKYCDKLKGSWNFVNGFDILAGTIAIYKGLNEFKKSFRNITSVDDFKDFSNTLGIGAIELAIALSTANPFLLVGATLHLTAGVRGLLNDGCVIYFENHNKHLSVKFSNDALNVKKYLQYYSVESIINKNSLSSSINSLKLRID